MAQKRDAWSDVIDFNNSPEAQSGPPRYTPVPDDYSSAIDFAPQQGGQQQQAPVSPQSPVVGGAGVIGAPTEMTFGDQDQSAGRPNLRLTPEQEAQVVHILSTAPIDHAADLARAYLKNQGWPGTQGDNFDNVVAARRSTGKVNEQFAYAKPQYTPSAVGAAAEGTAEGASVGAAPKLYGLLDAGSKALGLGGSGDPTDYGSFANNYNAYLDQYEGQRSADVGEHPYIYIGGQLAGGSALPSGAAAAADRAALAAGREALRSGATMEEARTIAQIAGRQAYGTRLAIEGAGYGGADGAIGADTPQDAIKSGLLGATLGGVAGKGFGELGRAAPIVRYGRDVVNKIDNLGQRLQDSMTAGGAYENAANLLGGALSGAPNDVLSAISTRAPAVDGVSPTLAEVAGDAGLAGFQRVFSNTNMNGAASVADRNVANALARTDAATNALRSDAPQSLQDYASGLLSDAQSATEAQRLSRQGAIDSRLADVRTAAANDLSSAQEAFSRGQDALSPIADRTATGSAVRSAFNDAYETAKAKTREAYSAPVLNEPQPIEIPQAVFAKVRDAADAFYGDGGGEIPPRLQSIIGDMADPNATTRTLTNMDRRLADFAGEARMQGRASEAAFAERVRSTLGDFTNSAAPKPYRDALAAAKAARSEQGRLFETGDAASVFSTDRYGVPTTGDTAIPTRLVRPGAAGGDTIDRLIASVGPDTAERTVRDELRRSIEEGGVNSGSQMTRLASRYGEAIKRFPQLRDDIAELQRNANALDAARTASAEAQRAAPTLADKVALGERTALHDKILSSPLAKLADPAVDPSAFVGSLLSRSDNGRQLQALARWVKDDPTATNGLRTALGDYIEKAGQGNNFSASGQQIPSVIGTRKAIDTVIKRAGDILTPQQKVVLSNVRRELQQANFAATAAKPAGSETAINRSFDDIVNGIPVLPSKTKSVLNMLYGVLGNRDQVKRLINQALLDPDFAATLLKRPTAQHWQRVQRNLSVSAPKRVGGVGIAPDIFGLQKALSDAFTGGVPLRAAADKNAQKPGVADGNSAENQPQYEGAQP